MSAKQRSDETSAEQCSTQATEQSRPQASAEQRSIEASGEQPGNAKTSEVKPVIEVLAERCSTRTLTEQSDTLAVEKQGSAKLPGMSQGGMLRER